MVAWWEDRKKKVGGCSRYEAGDCWGGSRSVTGAAVRGDLGWRKLEERRGVKELMYGKDWKTVNRLVKIVSLVPRPLPDFISQPWRKIGRRPSTIYVTDRKWWTRLVRNVDPVS